MRFLSLLLLAACSATAVDEYEVCALDIALNPTAGAPGDLITVTGTPFTEVRDTRIEVGGVSAQVELVQRVDRDACTQTACTDDEQCGGCGPCGTDGFCGSVADDPLYNCGLCDVCRKDAGCAPCGECQGLNLEPPTRVECFGDPLADPPVANSCDLCRETMVFVIPPLEPGLTAVFVTNRNGQSEAVPFEVLPGPGGTGTTGSTADTGTSDTGTTDTGTSDTAGGSGNTTGAPATGDTGDASSETASTGDTG